MSAPTHPGFDPAAQNEPRKSNDFNEGQFRRSLDLRYEWHGAFWQNPKLQNEPNWDNSNDFNGPN